MGEKAIKWMDNIYKLAVVLGSLAMIWAHATFASKDDLVKVSEAIHQIEIQISQVNSGLASQTAERGHLARAIDELKDQNRQIETRLRSMERK